MLDRRRRSLVVEAEAALDPEVVVVEGKEDSSQRGIESEYFGSTQQSGLHEQEPQAGSSRLLLGRFETPGILMDRKEEPALLCQTSFLSVILSNISSPGS